jgi:N-hydroxyarylamine O-acetyltransferase
MAGWMRDRYLHRLQVAWEGRADYEALKRLHRRHLEEVPFENLSVHLGEPIVLDEVELVAKIVVRHRGGFCYELNGAFAWLLRSLGYQVEYLEAGVFHDNRPGPHFDHMVLRVRLDEPQPQPWLVDVGFGDNHVEPLPFHVGTDKTDPNGNFRLVAAPADSEGAVDLWRDGEAQYHLDLFPHPLSAFEERCRFHQSSPESHFTRNTICSRATPHGRVTLRARTLIVTEDGSRTERDLDDAELQACYRDTFGIDLPEEGEA